MAPVLQQDLTGVFLETYFLFFFQRIQGRNLEIYIPFWTLLHFLSILSCNCLFHDIYNLLSILCDDGNYCYALY